MPRLESLTVRGFKSIRALEDFELRPLNVLIGPNGAGKSNLLSLFSLVHHLSQGHLQSFVENEGGADALLFGGRRQTSKIEAELSFEAGCREYRFSLAPTADTLVFGTEEILPSPAQPPGNASRRADGSHSESRVADIGRGEFASSVLPDMQRWHLFHFQDAGYKSQARLPSDPSDNLRLKPDGGNLAPVLRRLRERHPEHYRRVVETIRLSAPFFGDFVNRRNPGEQMDLEWFEADGDSDRPYDPRQLSGGTLRFICLVTLLHEPEDIQPDLLLIDEPELGLHPYAVTLLAEMIKQAADSQQIIVSTQSTDLVSHFAPEDVVVVNRRCGESVFGRLDSGRLSKWLEEYSLGDLWKMNVLGGRPGS